MDNSRLRFPRDAKRPAFVAHEFAARVDRMPELTGYRPGLETYLR